MSALISELLLYLVKFIRIFLLKNPLSKFNPIYRLFLLKSISARTPTISNKKNNDKQMAFNHL